jgi:hypothetical protein
MSTELEPIDAGLTPAGYNHCKRCGRKIKAPQEYGRVCARKVKADAEMKKEQPSDELKK